MRSKDSVPLCSILLLLLLVLLTLLCKNWRYFTHNSTLLSTAPYIVEYHIHTDEKQHLTIHRQNSHENESEIEDSDDDDYIPSPTYHCNLCSYSAMYPDNVAFHYGEIHRIKISWEEAEKNCKRLPKSYLWNWKIVSMLLT